MKNEKNLKVYCPYSALDLGWETLKNLQNITFKKPWYLKRTTMTQEEKDFLLKDLCARLPYKPIVHAKWPYTEPDGKIKYNEADRELRINDFYDIWHVKPYLRPMSLMSEEEYAEYVRLVHEGYAHDTVDYLNSIHVDYRCLIQKGLAIAVTEENNPYEA